MHEGRIPPFFHWRLARDRINLRRRGLFADGTDSSRRPKGRAHVSSRGLWRFCGEALDASSLRVQAEAVLWGGFCSGLAGRSIRFFLYLRRPLLLFYYQHGLLLYCHYESKLLGNYSGEVVGAKPCHRGIERKSLANVVQYDEVRFARRSDSGFCR